MTPRENGLKNLTVSFKCNKNKLAQITVSLINTI